MRFATSLLALAAAGLRLVSAQASEGTVDPETGIAYQQYRTDRGGGFSFGIAFPETAGSTEFIGRIEGPIAGWSGVSLGGGMVNNLLLAAWANGDNIVHSFRMVGGYVDPEPVNIGARATTLWSSTNSTHFKWTFRCQDCTQWEGGMGGFDPDAVVAVMGWAVHNDADSVVEPSNPDSVIGYHTSGFGQWGMRVGEAHSAEYQDWLDAAPGGGDGPTPTDPVPNPTPTTTKPTTPIPSATNVLGEADYIVVGGGAGGLVVADRLSEAGKSVILIERGPPSTGEHGGTMAPEWTLAENLTRFDVPGLCNEIWVNSAGVACTDIAHMAGCVLGGGTAVNAGMFFVPPTQDWDAWPSGWKANDVKAAQDKMFKRIPGTDTPSQDGKRFFQELYQAIGGAVKKSGWKEIPTINAQPNEKNHTYGPAPFMFINGERGGPLATYLVSAKKRSNFKLVMNTNVRRVQRTKGVISGVEVYASNGEGQTGIYKVKSGGSVVLAAGAFGTARVLFRSGIGPKDQLQVVKNSVADGQSMIAESDWILSPVGYNVIDHTNTDLVVSHPNVKTYDFYEAYDNPPAADAEAYLEHRAGVLANAAPGIPLVMYDKVKVSDGTTRQIQWTARAEGSLGEQGSTLVTISQYLGTGMSSRGRITISPTLEMSASTLPYLHTVEDKEAVIKGVHNMITALQAPGTGVTMLQPKAGVSAEDYVNAYVQNRGSNHWVGSAKIGTDDGTKQGGTKGDVVDLNTKVYGTENLYVVDASIFPGMVSTNPTAHILIAAEHATQRILKTSGFAENYNQCAGQDYVGPTRCKTGYTCAYFNPYYSACHPTPKA